MRQEHKLCAEVYHYLYDFIDHNKPVYFCLDGMAARNAGLFTDRVVPDLWFTLCGGSKSLRIEAKILDNHKKVKFDKNAKHPEEWSRQGDNSLKPHLWIASNEGMNAFWLWGHNCFEDQLRKGPNAKGEIKAPDCREEHADVRSLALAILAFAKRHGFLPNQRGVE